MSHSRSSGGCGTQRATVTIYEHLSTKGKCGRCKHTKCQCHEKKDKCRCRTECKGECPTKCETAATCPTPQCPVLYGYFTAGGGVALNSTQAVLSNALVGPAFSRTFSINTNGSIVVPDIGVYKVTYDVYVQDLTSNINVFMDDTNSTLVNNVSPLNPDQNGRAQAHRTFFVRATVPAVLRLLFSTTGVVGDSNVAAPFSVAIEGPLHRFEAPAVKTCY